MKSYSVQKKRPIGHSLSAPVRHGSFDVSSSKISRARIYNVLNGVQIPDRQSGKESAVNQSPATSGGGILRRQTGPTPAARSTTWKNVQINPVVVAGSSASPSADFTKANTIFSQCHVKVENVGTTTWFDTLSKQKIGNDLELDEYRSVGSPTSEETKLTTGQGTSGIVYAYYVKSLSDKHTGESFWHSSWNAPPAPALVRSNSGNTTTFCHELGHVLLDAGGHVNNTKNLMYGAKSSTKYKLTPTQCSKIRSNTKLVK